MHLYGIFISLFATLLMITFVNASMDTHNEGDRINGYTFEASELSNGGTMRRRRIVKAVRKRDVKSSFSNKERSLMYHDNAFANFIKRREEEEDEEDENEREIGGSKDV